MFNFVGEETIELDIENADVDSGGIGLHFFGIHKNQENRKILPLGFVWIRPSGTEPVVRLIADAVGENAKAVEKKLIKLWKNILTRARGF